MSQTPLELIRTRRSVVAANLGEPGPTPDEIDTIIECGLRVPDHSRCGPWRIQVVGKEGQAKLGELYAELFAKEHPEDGPERVEYWRNRPSNAPLLLVVTCYPNQEKIHKVPLIEQLMSIGAACQNILNGAHALGYAAQWLTEWPAYNDDVKKLLGHSPETDILGFIFVGTPTEPPKERNRIGPEDVVAPWNG